MSAAIDSEPDDAAFPESPPQPPQPTAESANEKRRGLSSAPLPESQHESSTRDARLSRPVSTKKRNPKSRWKRFRRDVGRKLSAWFGLAALSLLSRTWRPRREGEENIEAARGEGGGHFMALWHGRMLVPMAHHKKKGWVALVSQSGDGDLTESLLRGFGYGVIRGSSSRGGARALREMLDALRGGSVLIITPDGPRGPMHSMSPGLVWMARATGYAVVPCGFVCDRAWRLDSWDRFTVPKPFARLAFVFGKPIMIPRKATNPELELLSIAIRDALQSAERRGFELLGTEPAP